MSDSAMTSAASGSTPERMPQLCTRLSGDPYHSTAMRRTAESLQWTANLMGRYPERGAAAAAILQAGMSAERGVEALQQCLQAAAWAISMLQQDLMRLQHELQRMPRAHDTPKGAER